ncbi:uncharacterized protein LOC133186959 [Saccostrea echinata]|uniref:uncharacterized protein LOC133186959 n=1 Tax=Saccostrea echinata TaxID=191078 RepID=UPI002A820C1D|nr:uncharacterized protein LOC133186959 [Saccostrea echinata]
MQYTMIENMRPEYTPETFLGVIDIGKENVWTQLDGTVIDSSFTNTFDRNNGQPNGGNNQNCIVIDQEPHSYFKPDKTQDKSCFSDYKTKAMLCYIDAKEFCLHWASTEDSVNRNHCYWLTTKPRSSTRWNAMDALYRCTLEGGTLAPAIDQEQMTFIKQTLTSIFQSNSVTSTGVWMGSNTIRGKEWNWNNEPNFLSTSIGSTTPEKCMRLDGNSLSIGYVNCRQDSTNVRGAVCVRYGTGSPVPSPTESSVATTTETAETTVTTTTESTTITTTSEPTTTSMLPLCGPTTENTITSGVFNSTSVETIKIALALDPKNTTAYKSTLKCAGDDRVTSQYLGYTGAAVISAICATLILIDCDRMRRSGLSRAQR